MPIYYFCKRVTKPATCIYVIYQTSTSIWKASLVSSLRSKEVFSEFTGSLMDGFALVAPWKCLLTQSRRGRLSAAAALGQRLSLSRWMARNALPPCQMARMAEWSNQRQTSNETL